MTAPATKGRRSAMTLDRRRHDGPIALMATILEGTANLRGAACTDNPRLFDLDVDHADVGHADATARWREVQAVCRSCPVRAACWAWATEIRKSPGRPAGPLATTQTSPWRSPGRPAASAEPAPRESGVSVTEPEAVEVQESEPTEPEAATCDGQECDRPVLARGLCLAHYRRYRRDPDQPREHLLRPLRRSPGAAEEPAPEPPRPKPKRGARARIKPSINRNRKTNHR